MGKKKTKTSNASLGRSLINMTKKGATYLVEGKGATQPAVFNYTTDVNEKPNLKSVMEPNSLDEYV